MVSGAGGFIGSIVGGALVGGIGPAIGAALPSIADNAKVLVERLVPDANAREAAQAEVDAALAAMEVAKAQSTVNLAEAQGNDWFSARWRPSVGGICAAGFGYQFVLAPILTWPTNIVGVAIGASIPVAPMLSINDLMVVLTGILGLGVQRTVERIQGVSVAAPAGLK